jgi:Reverse transcriptase (RNA-dependent DNA polymerase)
MPKEVGSDHTNAVESQWETIFKTDSHDTPPTAQSRAPTVEEVPDDEDDDNTSNPPDEDVIKPVGAPEPRSNVPSYTESVSRVGGGEQKQHTPSCIQCATPKPTERPTPITHQPENAPAEKIAGACCSTRQRSQANKNAEYNKKLDEERFNRLQRMLEREAKRLAELTKDEDKHNASESAPNEPQDEWEDHIHFARLSSEGPSNENLPENLQDAYSRPDRDKWRATMHEELENLQTNHIYKEVPIPEGAKPITSKAAFCIKFDRNRNITRYKIHIVACGFVQQECIDYNEVFVPVASIESVRIIITLAAKYNLKLDQMDVTRAYLNGKLDEEIYLTPPEGTNIKPRYCWRLC